MANTLQIKRGVKANLGTLASGELGYGTDDIAIYVGDGAANHPVTMDESASHWRVIDFPCPSDVESDQLHFQLDLSANADFSSPIVAWDTRVGQDGVTGWQVYTGTEFNDMPTSGISAGYYGQAVVYTFQSSSISRGTVYFVRYRAHDGTDFGPYSGKKVTW